MSITNLAPEVQKSLLVRWAPVYRSQLHYLVTWGTRGRRSVLRDRHVEAIEKQLESLCAERGISLLEVAAGNDHVHVLFALKPTQSVASVVRQLKGATGVSLLERFPELRVWLGGNLLWEERYAVETVSGPRVERVRARLRVQHGAHEELAPTG
jgi:REP element-mobilizing transposase RayT